MDQFGLGICQQAHGAQKSALLNISRNREVVKLRQLSHVPAAPWARRGPAFIPVLVIFLLLWPICQSDSSGISSQPPPGAFPDHPVRPAVFCCFPASHHCFQSAFSLLPSILSFIHWYLLFTPAYLPHPTYIMLLRRDDNKWGVELRIELFY